MEAKEGYCPFCDCEHDAAPCPSPGEIAMRCTWIIEQREGQEEQPEKVIELPELGKGILY